MTVKELRQRLSEIEDQDSDVKVAHSDNPEVKEFKRGNVTHHDGSPVAVIFGWPAIDENLDHLTNC